MRRTHLAAFARIVPNPERLRALTILTGADIRAVGPGVWNGWKGQLLRQLYTSTESIFRGGRSSDLRRRGGGRRAAACWPTPPAAGWSAPPPDPAVAMAAGPRAMEDAYFVAFATKVQARPPGPGAAARRRTGPPPPPGWWPTGTRWRSPSPPATVAACSPSLTAAMAAARGQHRGRAGLHLRLRATRWTSSRCRTAPAQPFGEADPRGLDRLLAALEDRRARRAPWPLRRGGWTAGARHRLRRGRRGWWWTTRRRTSPRWWR